MKKSIKLEDLDCANCANKMEQAAKNTAGMKDATVNFMALKMHVEFEEGADVIDVGACSSRPGSVYPGEAEEWRRLLPFLKEIAADFPDRRFSVDTFSSEIVRCTYDVIGPFIVNDITAGTADSAMLETVAALDLPYIAMHSRGDGQTMDSLCDYSDVV